MTQNEIIRMAREACNPQSVDPVMGETAIFTLTELECFAALVAAHEREKLTVFDNSLKGQTNGTDNYKIYDGHYCNCSESTLYSGGYQRTPTQVNQNPVAWYLDTFDEDGELDYREYNSSNKFSCGRGNGTPLYAAPVSIPKQSETDSSPSLMRTTVHTKDLTDGEIWELSRDYGDFSWQHDTLAFARTVIAAYREKNK